MFNDLYYRHSGAIGFAGLAIMAIVGTLVSVVLGGVYGYAILYIPFVYINFFITLFYGAAVGYSVGFSGRLAKVRNLKVIMLMALVFGVFAVYTNWVSWLFAATQREGFALFVANPIDILNFMSLIAEEGAWTIFSWTPTGFALYLFWIAEALMIVGMSLVCAKLGMGDAPFCEQCGKWVDQKMSFGPLEVVAQPDRMKMDLEQRNFTSLKGLPPSPPGAAHYSQVEVLHCPSCEQLHLLSVKNVAVSVNSEGKVSTNEVPFVQYLLLRKEDYSDVVGHFSEMTKRLESSGGPDEPSGDLPHIRT